MSRRRAIEEENPDWDEERVDEELGLIWAESKREAEITGGSLGATMPPEEEFGGFEEESEEPGE
jgi:hypothetical protein